VRDRLQPHYHAVPLDALAGLLAVHPRDPEGGGLRQAALHLHEVGRVRGNEKLAVREAGSPLLRHRATLFAALNALDGRSSETTSRAVRELTTERIRRGLFHDVPELVEAIEVLGCHRKTSKSFVRTASAEKILAKVSRCRVILETLD